MLRDPQQSFDLSSIVDTSKSSELVEQTDMESNLQINFHYYFP